MKKLWILILLGALGCGGESKTPLLIYSPHGRDLLTLMEKTWEESHPQVDVRWLDMGSQEVFDRLRTEKANPQADLWFGGPDSIFARGAAEGLLQPYRPAWAEKVPIESRDEKDRYFGVYRTPAVLVFNSVAVSPEEAPTDWEDLVSPRFHGEVVIRDPMASGTMRTVFSLHLHRSLRETGSDASGFAWLKRLDAATRDYAHNPALLHEKIKRQEGTVTIWDLTDILLQKAQGAPVDYRFPSSGTAVIDDSIGLVAGAKHPEEARQFIDWVGEIEAQILAATEVYRLPARTDLPEELIPEWVGQVEKALVREDLPESIVSENATEWMRRWDRTVRGQG